MCRLSFPSSFPKEHLFNSDGYRYVLAEADPHAPLKQVATVAATVAKFSFTLF